MTEYLPTPNPLLRQGDIILAPTVVLLAGHEAMVDPHPNSPPRLGERRFIRPWVSSDPDTAPDVIAETWMSPVLVLSHECHLEKDFNERLRELMQSGMERDEAVHHASADPALDPFAVVAPLQPYSTVPPHRHAGIRSGNRIGYFALDALPGDGRDYVVDLGRACTVSVRLLARNSKVASLAPLPVSDLRFRIAEAYAIRDLAVIAELQAIVGQRILHAEALPKSQKKTALILHLDNGELVHLEIRRPRDEIPEEITRVPADPR
jgi:hypothetical protein